MDRRDSFRPGVRFCGTHYCDTKKRDSARFVSYAATCTCGWSMATEVEARCREVHEIGDAHASVCHG